MRKAFAAFLGFVFISGIGNAIFDSCPILGSVLIYGSAIILGILLYKWDKDEEE